MTALPEGISRPPNREDYVPIVKGLRPFVGEEELMLRASLLLMRDRAIATKNVSTTCEPAWILLNAVEQQAGEHALNFKMKVEDLRELRRLCLNVACAASSFDTLFRPSPPEAA